MSFPRKNGRRRERKRGTRKVSSTSRLRFARRTTPRVRTAPMSISSRVVVVFFLPRAFKAQFRDFLASGCVSQTGQNPLARGNTGRVRARERMRKASNLIDWVMPNAVAWVRARAIGRECVVARRCRRRFGPFLGPIFKGPKKGEGGASVLPNLFVRGGGGVCLLARTNVVGAARCFTSRCVLTSALSSLSFSFLQQQQQQHRTFL